MNYKKQTVPNVVKDMKLVQLWENKQYPLKLYIEHALWPNIVHIYSHYVHL